MNYGKSIGSLMVITVLTTIVATILVIGLLVSAGYMLWRLAS